MWDEDANLPDKLWICFQEGHVQMFHVVLWDTVGKSMILTHVSVILVSHIMGSLVQVQL